MGLWNNQTNYEYYYEKNYGKPGDKGEHLRKRGIPPALDAIKVMPPDAISTAFEIPRIENIR